MKNKPFIFGVATSGENFTDREKETERLLSNFRYDVNTVLISPRRWGKTSLVQKVCRLAESDELRIVYLDIFACRSLSILTHLRGCAKIYHFDTPPHLA